jgi:activator of 2-hydroxyglutaryl-CoA dehydratase/predicted nucleotide-binding protein (sugar kinase/HSP70/actin superfamily)
MNGSCAGGTGAFIDQMATLLNLSLEEMDTLAASSTRIFPVASRCGVFAKTDVQNLVSRKIDITDISASILQAVVVQNLNSLARGIRIRPKVLLCGGPLTFLPSLRERFRQTLGLSKDELVLPAEAEFFPARGAALETPDDLRPERLKALFTRMQIPASGKGTSPRRLPPLFPDKTAYAHWEKNRPVLDIPEIRAGEAEAPFFLGIDCGSTTTKVMVLDRTERIVFREYRQNRGNPVEAVLEALKNFRARWPVTEGPVILTAGAVTGYGEDLILATLDMDLGTVETVAHWRAAVQCDPHVSFILDIGGQDMKAIFVRDHAIHRIEINEACSSGCGTFIEGFAHSLGLNAEAFALSACRSKAPCDLGTRCTVFMNSRIKQAHRENASIGEIAAGLGYSVVKNSLHKVLKLRDLSELGDHIVAQGGTFRNPAVLRALELLTGRSITTSNWPEMMGAYGAALLAKDAYDENPSLGRPVDLSILDASKQYTTRLVQCQGCTNQCPVTVFTFHKGRRFYSGNRCERVFSNQGKDRPLGTNLFAAKNRLLFDRSLQPSAPVTMIRIGIPRILGMYENFPFWCTLFKECGFEVVLSNESSQAVCDKGLGTVMSDNICFPAKLAHGHVVDLLEQGVDRIFYPMTFNEVKEDAGAANSYNCPIVSSYSEVLKDVVPAVAKKDIPLDTPPVSFRDERLLKKACFGYLKSLGVSRRRFKAAFSRARKARNAFLDELDLYGENLLKQAGSDGTPVMVLAGRPYHVDPFIEHQTSEILTDLGVHVIPVDIAARLAEGSIRELNTVSQWAYPNRLFKAAQWVAQQADSRIQYVMLNSFGCGPDAFIMDEIRDILSEAGKTFSLIRIDEIASTGSTRLRLRSQVETLKWWPRSVSAKREHRRIVRSYTSEDLGKTVIAPYFADCYSPFFRPVFRLLGHELEILDPSDKESVEYGLTYANNEICYPATVIIGDFIKAFKTGLYDPARTVVVMSQTGGQCRATCYLPLIKRALMSAGYPEVPVVAAATSDSLNNEQPAFDFNYRRIIKPAFASLLFADAIARMYHRSVVRECSPGLSRRARDHYLKEGARHIETGDPYGLIDLLTDAVNEFNEILGGTPEHLPRIGIVGEIFLKYNTFSQMHMVDWLISQGVEVTVPSLMDFVLQYFVNRKVNRRVGLEHGRTYSISEAFLSGLARKWIGLFDQVLQGFYGYEPSPAIHEKAGSAKKIINLANQFGEGWLIPAEIAGFANEGIWDVVCLQPFGCIANHVIAKGIERKIKNLYPKVNLLFIDFDAGTSEVNILNRLHFMIRNAQDHLQSARLEKSTAAWTKEGEIYRTIV